MQCNSVQGTCDLFTAAAQFKFTALKPAALKSTAVSLAFHVSEYSCYYSRKRVCLMFLAMAVLAAGEMFGGIATLLFLISLCRLINKLRSAQIIKPVCYILCALTERYRLQQTKGTLMRLLIQYLIISCCIMSLVACGGGGGSDTSPTPPVVSSSSSSNFSSSSSVSSNSKSSVSSSSSISFNSSVSSSSKSSVSSASSSLASLTSSNSSASSQALAVPQNLSVKPGNATATLTWNAVAGATSYHVYYATEPNILSKNISAFQNGTWIKNVTTPYTATGLQNNKTYYFVVTAVKASEESAQSLEVSTTPSADDPAKQPTAQEVLVNELINRARFDPTAEATRYGIGLNDGITGTPITADRKPPIALNLLLTDAARVHSQWMLDNDIFSHTGANNNSPTDRMIAAGYVFTGSWSNGENIAWAGTTAPSIDLTQNAIAHHEGLFKSPGHRENILGTSFRELGIGQKQGYFITDGRNYLSSMLTEDFAKSGTSYFLTGVVYADANNNQFYDVGEGLDGITISTNGKSYPVYATGAYSIPLTNGTYDLVITGAPLANVVNYRVQINSANIKLNVIKSASTATVVSW